MNSQANLNEFEEVLCIVYGVDPDPEEGLTQEQLQAVFNQKTYIDGKVEYLQKLGCFKSEDGTVTSSSA